MPDLDPFSRREREIMDIVYAQGHPTASDVRSAMPDPPSYSAVRALLATLVKKGALEVERDGPRYRYGPTQSASEAGESALQRVVRAFFAGSAARAALQLLRMDDALDASEIDALEARLHAMATEE